MGCCANTFPREPTCPRTHPDDSSRWPPSSTTGPAKPWAASPPHKPCNAYCWTPNHPSLRQPPEFALGSPFLPRPTSTPRSAQRPPNPHPASRVPSRPPTVDPDRRGRDGSTSHPLAPRRFPPRPTDLHRGRLPRAHQDARAGVARPPAGPFIPSGAPTNRGHVRTGGHCTGTSTWVEHPTAPKRPKTHELASQPRHCR